MTTPLLELDVPVVVSRLKVRVFLGTSPLDDRECIFLMIGTDMVPLSSDDASRIADAMLVAAASLAIVEKKR